MDSGKSGVPEKKEDMDSRGRRWKRRNKKVDEILESGLGGTIFCCKPFLFRANRYRYIARYAFLLYLYFSPTFLLFSPPLFVFVLLPIFPSFALSWSEILWIRTKWKTVSEIENSTWKMCGWVDAQFMRCKCKTIKSRIDRKTKDWW